MMIDCASANVDALRRNTIWKVDGSRAAWPDCELVSRKKAFGLVGCGLFCETQK